MANQAVMSDSTTKKIFLSPAYNFVFDKTNGQFARWGVTKEDDPQWSSFGPEIADIEVSKSGCRMNCKYCYKSNVPELEHNMTLAEFKVILDKLGPQLTQVAFGICDLSTNPDFLDMMQHCRLKGVVPNFTTNGLEMTDQWAEDISCLAGAVAVSYHGNVELCFTAVEKLCKHGMTQVNIHAVTTSFDAIMALMDEIVLRRTTHPDFKLNALVLLSLKAKGRAKQMHSIDQEALGKIIAYAGDLDINLGFDSCSAEKALEIYPAQFHTMIEPCESGLFSSYIDCYGEFHPCSFAEETKTWPTGISVLNCDNFLTNVWHSERVSTWRQNLINNGRNCPLEF